VSDSAETSAPPVTTHGASTLSPSGSPPGGQPSGGPPGGQLPQRRATGEELLKSEDLEALFWRVSGLALLVLLFGGLALRAYAGMRFREHLNPPDDQWWVWLGVFSVAGGIAIGALAVCWRLANRKKGEARWGMALALLVIVLFGLIVWPTPWTYRAYGCKIFQINRLIGRMTPLDTTVPGCKPGE
jgi:hypothetical protein